MKRVPEELYKKLKKGEEVKFAFKQSFHFDLKPKWLIITNYRVIFLDLNIGGSKFIDFPYEELQTFMLYSGFVFAHAYMEDEKGNKRSIPYLRRPTAKEWDELTDYIMERIQDVSVENPTIHTSKFFFIRKFLIQKVPETSSRVKMQYVPSTTENMPRGRALSTSSDAPKNIAKLSPEEAKKLVYESEKKYEQIKVLKQLFDDELIDEETYETIKKEILET